MKDKNSDHKTGPQRLSNGQLVGGNPGNSGGKVGRSGRRPSVVKMLAQQLLADNRVLAVLAAIVRAEIAEEWLDQEGEVHSTPTRNADRIQAAKLLLMVAGELPQRVEHVGEDGGPIEVVQQAQAQFQSRMDRLTQRLGAAAFPEFPER